MNIVDFKKRLNVNYTSNCTIKTYTEQMSGFLMYCNNNVTQEKIDDYMIFRRKEVSIASCNLFINSLKKYCEYCGAEFNFPKQKTTKIKFNPSWTLEELEGDILYNIYGEKDVLLRLMFFTGLRPHEVCKLKTEDIDFRRKMFVINGKGGKERIIPFLDMNLTKKLESHVKNRNIVFDINENKLRYMFKRIKEDLSLDYKVTPYIMRRSFACYCDDLGMSLSILQALMGHNDIKTTERYIKSNPKRVISVCEKFMRN